MMTKKWVRVLGYIGIFTLFFGLGAASKVLLEPAWAKDYQTEWNDKIGTTVSDIAYGDGEAHKFDLYLPADKTKASYKLVVYLHAGGFTMGDKTDDREMLRWLASKGYVAAGINYTLRNEENNASVYSQSMEIKNSMPVVIEEAKKQGYTISEMAISGGSAGHALAMIYAYRDAKISPVPVKMVFGAVGPSSFYPEAWSNYGLDQNTEETREAAAGLFGIMAGKTITPDMIGSPEYDEAVKDISALLWIDEDSVPSLMAYGKYDKVQPYKASVRLQKRLEQFNVPHDYIVLEHSGHGLQNDDKEFQLYYQKIEDYLETYLPVE
ncbi:alpha/beta hydrolase [Streptococcus merionis]|uniref:alpha/beta hydrolase n=1 Tax=Streptococcus merionis TaxID=400065 RepID=UPI003516BE83